jgi:hypothetical protein
MNKKVMSMLYGGALLAATATTCLTTPASAAYQTLLCGGGLDAPYTITTNNAPYDQPRITFECSGEGGAGPHGSPWNYFAFRISDNPAVAQMLQQLILWGTINTGNRDYPLALQGMCITFDPNDTSGNAWGCGSSNCRIIRGIKVPFNGIQC